MNIVIRAMKNNTFLHLTTPQGGLVYTVTAKNSGARGTGKSTIKEGTCLAVSRLARRIRRLLSAREEDFIEKIKKKHQITCNLLEMGFHVRISGLGVGRVPALLELSRMGLNFDRLTEETRLKHGGNRARKPRRT